MYLHAHTYLYYACTIIFYNIKTDARAQLLNLNHHQVCLVCSFIHVQDMLVTVFENGTIVKEYSLDEIRKNARLWEEELNPAQHNQDHTNTLDMQQKHIMNGVH